MYLDGVTYAEAAKAIGISPNTFTSRINANSPFSVAEVLALAQYLHISPVDLSRYFISPYAAVQKAKGGFSK